MIGYYQLPGAIKLLQPDYFVSHYAHSVHQPDKNIKAVMHHFLSSTDSSQAITRQNRQYGKTSIHNNKPPKPKMKKQSPVAIKRQP